MPHGKIGWPACSREDARLRIQDLEGWIPACITWHDSQPLVEWQWLGERRFTEPFFSETLNRARLNPFMLLFRHRTPVETLRERTEIRPGIPLSGFIFHMSRCGSTLVSQALSALPENLVISEAPPLDALLRGGPYVDPEQRAEWVRWLIAALGQPRTGHETRYFVKLDCWHIPYLPLLKKAIPEVPWIFLYRDPIEVLASHEVMPALWRVPGILDPGLIGEDLAAVGQMDRLEYCARVLGKVCGAALRFRTDPRGRFVNYTELPDALWTTVATHFGMALSLAEAALMREKACFDAKVPEVRFENDSEAKRRRLSGHADRLAERWLQPAYYRLEQTRTERNYLSAEPVCAAGF